MLFIFNVLNFNCCFLLFFLPLREQLAVQGKQITNWGFFGHKYHVQKNIKKIKQKKRDRQKEGERQGDHKNSIEDSGILKCTIFLCTDEI